MDEDQISQQLFGHPAPSLVDKVEFSDVGNYGFDVEGYQRAIMEEHDFRRQQIEATRHLLGYPTVPENNVTGGGRSETIDEQSNTSERIGASSGVVGDKAQNSFSSSQPSWEEALAQNEKDLAKNSEYTVSSKTKSSKQTKEEFEKQQKAKEEQIDEILNSQSMDPEMRNRIKKKMKEEGINSVEDLQEYVIKSSSLNPDYTPRVTGETEQQFEDNLKLLSIFLNLFPKSNPVIALSSAGVNAAGAAIDFKQLVEDPTNIDNIIEMSEDAATALSPPPISNALNLIFGVRDLYSHHQKDKWDQDKYIKKILEQSGK